MLKTSLKRAVIALVVAVAAGSAAAQQGADPKAPTVTRTPLRTQDLPMPGGFVATLVRVELPVGAREGRHMHSGTLVAYVAAGRLDGFWEIGLSRWDMAAGSLLITEAGGLVGDLEGNEGYMESGHIVAANPKVFAEMVRLLAAHLTPTLKSRPAAAKMHGVSQQS